MDVFRIEGGNGTEKIRIEPRPADEAGEVKGEIWRPRHDEVKRKPQTPPLQFMYAILAEIQPEKLPYKPIIHCIYY
jgi:hypothetical protein